MSETEKMLEAHLTGLEEVLDAEAIKQKELVRAGFEEAKRRGNLLKEAEHRGYTRGYAAGKKKLEREEEKETRYAIDCAFREKAFMAALPVAMQLQGWCNTVDGVKKTITSLKDRVGLAWSIANEAVKTRPYF